MNKKRIPYWTALVATGLVSLALHFWAATLWMDQVRALGWGHFRGMHVGHPGAFAMMAGFWLVVIVVGLFFWARRRRATPVDPLGDLAHEYVEGRIGREEFLSRRAVLEEQ